MNFEYLTILAICFFASLFSCTQPKESTQLAFYHWQTTLDLSDFEKNYFEETGSKKLYVKFFDVDWDASQAQAIPLALLNIGNKELDSLEIVPCVFITNRTMLNTKEKDLPALAKNIHIKITELSYALPRNSFREIQIDCDWSASTKENYFFFLKELKTFYPEGIQLSATIRLHQIKYFEKTGVPPVDRGMLMYYNMGDLDNLNTDNSILDPQLAKAYLRNFDLYPLELDVALPIFAWGVLIRDGKVIKLINNLKEEILVGDERFIVLDTNLFEVQQSTYLDGYYLYEKDVIRTEAVSIETLQVAVRQLKPLIQTKDLTLSLYHLDSLTVRNYEIAELRGLWE